MTSFFDQVQAVLAGTARFPLDNRATKVLHFMLERGEGCDVTLKPDTFYIAYVWHPSHHRYFHDIAPRVVSWLCDAAPLGYLPAGALRWWFEHPGDDAREGDVDTAARRAPFGPHWKYGAHRVWRLTSPERIEIRIRGATIDPGAEAVPPPIPEPIDPPIVYLDGERPCPHCGVVPERYRRLGDGWLVCLACGRSSAP